MGSKGFEQWPLTVCFNFLLGVNNTINCETKPDDNLWRALLISGGRFVFLEVRDFRSHERFYGLCKEKHPAAACRSRRGCTWGGAARAAPPTMLLIG